VLPVVVVSAIGRSGARMPRTRSSTKLERSIGHGPSARERDLLDGCGEISPPSSWRRR